MKIRIVSGELMNNIIDETEVISRLEECFIKYSRGEVQVPPRTVLWIKGNWWGVMPAHIDKIGFGLKVVSVIPENIKRGLPTIPGIALIFDEDTGLPLSVMDGAVLTGIRTAGASAISVKYLKPIDGGDMTIIGAGYQARYHIRFISHVYKIERVKIYDININRSNKLSKFCDSIGIDSIVYDNLMDAQRDSPLVVETSTTDKPVIYKEPLPLRVHIVSIGAHTIDSRAIEDKVFMSSDLIIVDSREATFNETGDIRRPIEEGLLSSEDILELGEFLMKKEDIRREDIGISIYKSVGIAVQDACIGKYVFDIAMEKDVGIDVEL
jgi:alanine dehydrogenase